MMMIYRLTLYDDDGNISRTLHFKTKALASRQLKIIEEEVGDKLDDNNWNIYGIEVMKKVEKPIKWKWR